LVKASIRQQALSHVAQSLFTVRVASQEDLIKALSSGIKVENARDADQLELPQE
jgi:plasmid rolling circle replication initiator protein Rep